MQTPLVTPELATIRSSSCVISTSSTRRAVFSSSVRSKTCDEDFMPSAHLPAAILQRRPARLDHPARPPHAAAETPKRRPGVPPSTAGPAAPETAADTARVPAACDADKANRAETVRAGREYRPADPRHVRPARGASQSDRRSSARRYPALRPASDPVASTGHGAVPAGCAVSFRLRQSLRTAPGEEPRVPSAGAPAAGPAKRPRPSAGNGSKYAGLAVRPA